MLCAGGWGTLLGPEGTHTWVCVSVVDRAGWLSNWVCCGLSCWRVVVDVGGGWVTGVGVLFENCIVDASIFVVKLLRAHGGCLGTRSR